MGLSTLEVAANTYITSKILKAPATGGLPFHIQYWVIRNMALCD